MVQPTTNNEHQIRQFLQLQEPEKSLAFPEHMIPTFELNTVKLLGPEIGIPSVRLRCSPSERCTAQQAQCIEKRTAIT